MYTNEDQRESQPAGGKGSGSPAIATWLMVGALAAGAGGLGYGIHSRNQAAELAQTQQANVQAVSEMQKEMQTLTTRLSAQETRERELRESLAAAEQAAAEQRSQAAAKPASSRTTAAPQRASAKKAVRPADDPRFKQIEKRFADQDEKLAGTQQMVQDTRTDLEGRISSTASELNGSIARTSDEVAELRRRGERDYFEFDIPKSKQLQRVGPLGVALRKTDTKRKRFNVDLLVDDNKLEKKNVNLYEPVYLNTPEFAHPVELVVNRVDKNRVTGYISVPKVKRADMVSSADRSRMAEPQNPVPEE